MAEIVAKYYFLGAECVKSTIKFRHCVTLHSISFITFFQRLKIIFRQLVEKFCIFAQKFKHPNFQTFKHSNFQTFKLSNIQTFKLSNFQTFKPSNFQTIYN